MKSSSKTQIINCSACIVCIPIWIICGMNVNKLLWDWGQIMFRSLWKGEIFPAANFSPPDLLLRQARTLMRLSPILNIQVNKVLGSLRKGSLSLWELRPNKKQKSCFGARTKKRFGHCGRNKSDQSQLLKYYFSPRKMFIMILISRVIMMMIEMMIITRQTPRYHWTQLLWCRPWRGEIVRGENTISLISKMFIQLVWNMWVDFWQISSQSILD